MAEIFVFGSNRAGIHGAGAALHARKYHGAIQGIGEGLRGSSYALPTKDHRIQSLELSEIEYHIKKFQDVARSHPKTVFKVTRIGCGLAGYRDWQIAPLFLYSPPNCIFDEKWKLYLGDDFAYFKGI